MSAAVDGYADVIMTLIAADIAAGIVPDRVASFTALHSAVDANGYIEAAAVPWGAGHGYELANEVCAEVSQRLASRARRLDYTDGYRDGRADALRARERDITARGEGYREGYSRGHAWTLAHMPTAACYYIVRRDYCQGAAVVRYGPVALCGECDARRSTIGKGVAGVRL